MPVNAGYLPNGRILDFEEFPSAELEYAGNETRGEYFGLGVQLTYVGVVEAALAGCGLPCG